MQSHLAFTITSLYDTKTTSQYCLYNNNIIVYKENGFGVLVIDQKEVISSSSNNNSNNNSNNSNNNSNLIDNNNIINFLYKPIEYNLNIHYTGSKDIKQLDTLTSAIHSTKTDLLLILADELYVYDFTSKQITNMKNTKALSFKKHVHIYVYNNAFVLVRDIPITDKIIELTFLNESSLLLGYRDKYTLLNFGSLDDKDPNSINYYMKDIFGIGKNGIKPVSCILNDEIDNQELLLARDTVGISVNFAGLPTRAGPTIDWGDLPQCIACVGPYLVSMVTGRGLIIRNIQTSNVCQVSGNKMKTTGTMAFLGHSKQPWFLLTSSNSIQLFEMVPLPLQIEQLVVKQEYSEALSLLPLVSDKVYPTKIREEKAKEIKTSFGYWLFSQGEFDNAMHMFQDIQMNPRIVIKYLFPSLMPATYHPLNEIVIPSTWDPSLNKYSEASIQAAIPCLIPFLQQVHGRLLMRTSEIPDDVFVRFSSFSSLRIVLILIDLFFLSQNSNEFKSPKNKAEGNVAPYNIEDIELCMLVDTVLLKAYLLTEELLVFSFVQSLNRIAIDEATSLLRLNEKYLELIALYKNRSMHRAALELLQDMSSTAPSYFLNLYYYLSYFSNSILRGNDQLILYLQDLVSDSEIIPSHIPAQIQLILSFSKPILISQPLVGLSIFTQCHRSKNIERSSDNIFGSIVPPANVLEHIKRTCPDISISIVYLESLIHESGEIDVLFHNELISLYLESLLKMNDIHSVNEEKYNQTRYKLITFLRESPYYTAEKLLTKFPWDNLLEERALLLARIGQHEAALTIYAHSLHDHDAAENYCHQFYNEESEEAKDVYLTLLKVYLTPYNKNTNEIDVKFGESPTFSSLNQIIKTKDINEETIEIAIQFLCRNSNRISPALALGLFSNSTPLHKITPFINSVLASSSSYVRHFQIEKNLLRAEYIQLQEENLKEKNYRVVIDYDTVCSKCDKRIGMSAFIVLPKPSRDILHYKCSEEKFNKINKMKIGSYN